MRSVVWLSILATASAWQQWQWSPSSGGPSERFGHTILVDNGKIILFGGRSNDIVVEHIPKTYELQIVNGSLDITTYDSNTVRDVTCLPNATTPEECANLIDIALLHNDVWSYDTDCERYADNACVNSGWTNLHPGARHGGCAIIVDPATREWREDCPVPFERFAHTAVIHDFASDGKGMFLFGGFAQFCEDYCEDSWVFNFASQTWRRVNTTTSAAGPGKRWRFANVYDNGTLWMFGGHRLWHGFNPLNSVDNNWAVTTPAFPTGGYMDDLWSLDVETGTWRQYSMQTQCSDIEFPGQSWEDRNDVFCFKVWPSDRAAAGLAAVGNVLYMHGGYRTPFPYPTSGGAGASSGVNREPTDGTNPYPTHPNYLADMWRFDMTTGFWTEVVVTSPAVPSARADHVLVHVGAVLFAIGGYADNVFHDDTWQFNLTTAYWREKTSFVHALFSENCTDDTLTGAFSVSGEPTRGRVLDGEEGRKSSAMFVPQMRRRAPGWDGCRDRADGRSDLEQKLLWRHPPQRAGHSAALLLGGGQLFVYGGRGYSGPVDANNSVSPASSVLNDLWQYSLTSCHNNCTGHGACLYGYCICDPGFYGVDCSNVSCAGDYCFYDPNTLEQTCHHCCHATHAHADTDNYTAYNRKVPCGATHSGSREGICDGFGRCQCAPPFITDDCSTKDCPEDCAGHGFCSVEYPTSRCVCDLGWFGETCNTYVCPNNCSYPNGICNNGTCTCNVLNNPYNRSIQWEPWGMEDCSAVPVYAAAPLAGVASLAALVVAAVATAALFHASSETGRL